MPALRTLLLACCLPLCLPTLLAASAVDDYKAAAGSDDATEKRAALQKLAGSSEKDEVILPLLVGAVGDRQTHDAAIQALRSRTHLAPAPTRGQSHYPNYPSGDTVGDWQTWLSERTREKTQDAKVKEAEKLALEAKKKADATDKDKDEKDKGKDKDKDQKAAGDKPEGEGTPATTDEAKPAKPEQAAPTDLGKPVRVVFKNGSNLVCFILTRRTDADGNLLTLRIVHPDGSGEETLQAALIARIEEEAPQ